jgi:hypothetical protein
MIQKGIANNDVSEEKKGASNEREEKEKKIWPFSASNTWSDREKGGIKRKRGQLKKKKSDSSGFEHTVELRCLRLIH